MSASKEYMVCVRCAMDTTAPEIIFDESGVCNFCKHYDQVLTKDLFVDKDGKAKLNSLIEKVKSKGKNQKYDCLIGLSGGVDSSYVAYLVRKVYGLRALAIHLDNGWNTELAVSNVEKIVNKLDIDLITHVLDWKEFRDIQTSFMRSSISNIEIPTDHAIWAVLIKTAGKMGIPYIVAGNNVVTESIMPASWLYGSKDSRLIKSIHSAFGTRKMKSYPRLTTYDYVYYLLFKGIKWLPILNYIPYQKEEAKQLLMKELNWRDYGGKHYESIFTRFFHAYYLPQKYGYDLRKSYLSALICSGQISRESAMTELKNPPATDQDNLRDKEYVLKKLGISMQEFENIMNAEVKYYHQYGNNHWLWTTLSWFVEKARNKIIRVA